MALDDLKTTIETLQKRIQAHRAYLEGYETRTRQSLIDPMLRELGWNVEDPHSVELEYKVEKERLDYVLMGSDKPIAVIEAKVLGTLLDEQATKQALGYANMAGIPYMALTNGDHWRMLEVFRPVPINDPDRILMDFQLTQDEPYACALQALGLWRPNLASGKLPKEATTPVMIKSSPEPEPSSEKEIVEPSNNGNWVPIKSLKIKKGKRRLPPPNAIKFPDSSTKPIRYWVDMLKSIAQYLVETGQISAQNCPVHKERKKRYLVHTQPIHGTGCEFAGKQEIGDLWLETFSGGVIEMHKNACWLLEHFGIDPSTVLVTNPR